MRNFAIAVVLLGLAACGGDDDSSTIAPEPAAADDQAAPTDDDGGGGDDEGDGGDEGGNDDGGGDIVNRQPAGQALVSVDGREYTLTEPGALACTISDDAVTFSYRIGDTEVTLGAGANKYDDDWLGNIRVAVANPDGEDGPIGYAPDLAANGDGLVIDGSSASYAGPMLKQPPNDGTNPPPIDVGDGIISVTC